MIDQIYDRHYQVARETMNATTFAALKKFFASAGAAFRTLNRIEYSAPWNERARPARCS